MSTRIAILGGGVMGETLLAALLSADHTPADVVVAEKREERAEELRSAHGVDVLEPIEATRDADVVLLVVKPHQVVDVAREVAPALGPDTVVVSVAAGITCAAIEAVVPSGTAVVRAMPNTPAVVGEGMFGISPGASVADAQLVLVDTLLSSAGVVVTVDESLQDAIVCTSGSGPAYVFYLAEAMVEGGVRAGLDDATARLAVVQTLKGAAALLESSDDDPAELRRRVTSPNGTTHAAITTFDEKGVRDGLLDGIEACRARAAELSGS